MGFTGADLRPVQQHPTGFVPGQDKQYLVSFAQLPDAASLDRTEAVIREMSRIALEHPGVDSAGGLPWAFNQWFYQQPQFRNRVCYTQTF